MKLPPGPGSLVRPELFASDQTSRRWFLAVCLVFIVTFVLLDATSLAPVYFLYAAAPFVLGLLAVVNASIRSDAVRALGEVGDARMWSRADRIALEILTGVVAVGAALWLAADLVMLLTGIELRAAFGGSSGRTVAFGLAFFALGLRSIVAAWLAPSRGGAAE